MEKDEVEVLLGELFGGAAHGDAGVVDQDVHAADGFEHAFGQLCSGLGRRQVGFEDDRIVGEFAGHAVQVGDGAAGEHDPSTGGIEGSGAGFADAACGTGHYGDLVLQVVHFHLVRVRFGVGEG